MFTLISWVEETNRLILNLILDSRSETDIKDCESSISCFTKTLKIQILQ